MNKTIKVGGSTATCIQASRCARTGKEIFTLELEYPRSIHAQLLTHSVFSKCSSSTRAVPLEAAIKQILSNPAKYVWTENQSGMQGAVIVDTSKLNAVERLFEIAKMNAVHIARNMSSVRSWGQNIHKQNSGRLLEPFQNIKIVLTSTEWENWDWLRDDEDAQGEIADLARAMKLSRESAGIMDLNEGDWHVPYVRRSRSAETGEIIYSQEEEHPDGGFVVITEEQAKKISSSVCAQTSYRKADHSIEKADKMEGMLINGRKVHASPFEHQASPIPKVNVVGSLAEILDSLPDGVTHIRKDRTYGSGNLVGWIQYRQLIKGHDKALS